MLASHDLEDIITVIDGRLEITAEIASAPHDVRRYIALEVSHYSTTRSSSKPWPACFFQTRRVDPDGHFRAASAGYCPA